MAKLKSPFDDKKFDKKDDLVKYVKKHYIDKIPASYNGDVDRFLYDFRNPKRRRCQICGTVTQWNPDKKHYNVLCSIPDTYNPFTLAVAYFRRVIAYFNNKGNTCDQVMRKTYLENINRVHNTSNLMESSEYQEFLLKHRSIAHIVKYKGVEYTVIGNYEKLFVETLDKSNVDWKLIMPRDKLNIDDPRFNYTIVDAYIPDLKLYISIKDDGKNPAYKKNYIKSCVIYYECNKKGIKFIELNNVDQIKDYVSGKISSKDTRVCPIYMESVEPELYNKLK